jgi:hypothetical protein
LADPPPVDPVTGELINNTGFLRAERYLLEDRGWTFDPKTRFWYPGAKMSGAMTGDARRSQLPRSRLGFAAAVLEEFGFLPGLGFRVVERTDTFVRYETGRRFVHVFHGRGSYELGVEIGRWVDVGGELREQFFPLRDVIARRADLAEVGYGGLAATDARLVRKFVHQLGRWTRQFAAPLLSDGDQEFDKLSEINTREAESHAEALRVSRLRARAAEAWQRRDFGTVVNAYSEIEAELPTVDLKPSERAKLGYALKALYGRDD